MYKKLTIVASLLIGIGIVGSIITFSSSNETMAVHESQTIPYENINSLSINVVTTDIEVFATEDSDEARIELIGETNELHQPKFSVEVDDTQLIIDVQPHTENKWFNFDLYLPTLTLKVFLPEKFIENLKIKSVSADLYLNNVQANTTKLSSTSGDMDGEKLFFEKAELNTVSGDVEIEEIEGAIDLETTSGDVSLTVKDLSDTIQITSVSGDVDIVTYNKPPDVTFNVKSISGDINLLDTYRENATIGKGSHLIKIKTTSGDIAVTSD